MKPAAAGVKSWERTRLILLSAAALVAVAIVGLTWLTPFPGLAFRILAEELFPATISWDSKTAWRRCDSAIAGRTAWPANAAAACEAMHLCADEAQLSDSQRHMLGHAASKTPGCAAL